MLRAKTFSVCLIIYLLFALNTFAQEEKPGASSPLQKGTPNAEFTIEVFNDYQCPSCAAFNEKLKQIEAKYPEKILIIYRNFPLTGVHPNAVVAAKAVEAAGKQGKFSEMLDLIYQKQNKWSKKTSAEESFIRYAEKLNLDVETFKQDFQSQEILERINLDIERARSLGLTYTPFVLLNGKELPFDEAQDIEEIISKNNSKSN
jgi:protein-disulfide isomerase